MSFHHGAHAQACSSKLAGSPGWPGRSADAAQEACFVLQQAAQDRLMLFPWWLQAAVCILTGTHSDFGNNEVSLSGAPCAALMLQST